MGGEDTVDRYETLSGTHPLVLTLTTTGANQVLAAIERMRALAAPPKPASRSRYDEEDDDEDYEDWDSESDARDSAGAAIESAARSAGHVFVFKKAKLGSRGDGPVFGVQVPVASGLSGVTLVVIGGADRGLVVGAADARYPPPRTAIRWTGRVDTDQFDTRPLPAELVSKLAAVRATDEIKEDVERRLREWQAYLDVEEKFAQQRQFVVAYSGKRSGNRPGVLRLSIRLDRPADAERLAKHRDLVGVHPASAENVLEDDFGSKLADARILDYDQSTQTLTLELEQDDGVVVSDAVARIPPTGQIANHAVGDLTIVRRQRRAITRLRAGEAALANLDGILYGSNDRLDLPVAAHVDAVPTSQCLAPDRINVQQRLAVAMALDTPDCFFLQGPPGTGKTTVIAELCYQVARRGGRVLVSSQANLAVDNALSRLEKHADVLAVRYGDIRRIEDEGLPFVGENAVRRWLRGVADTAKSRLAGLERVGRVADAALEERQLLVAWCARGAPRRSSRDADSSRVTLSQALAKFRDLRDRVKDARMLLAEYESKRDATARARAENVAAAERAGDIERRFRQACAMGFSLSVAGSDGETPPRVLATCARWARIGSIADRPQLTRAAVRSIQLRDAISQWIASEQRGDDHAAEHAVAEVQGCVSRELAGTRNLLTGWWHRMRLRRGQRELRDAARQVADECASGGSLWSWARQEFEGRAASEGKLARKFTAEAELLTKQLAEADADFGRSDERISAAETILDAEFPTLLGGPATRAASLHTRLVQFDERLQSTEDQAASAAWTDLQDVGLTRGELDPTTLSAALDAIAASRGPGAPGTWRAEAVLLADWIARVEAGNADVSEQLQRAFDSAANVIGVTCSLAGDRRFCERYSAFDMVIVDEVSKATPTELLLPCMLGERVVLVGDHRQLPPIFGEEDSFAGAAATLGISTSDIEQTLTRSLFGERFEHFSKLTRVDANELGGAGRALMLTRQYRMHSHIMQGINQFYGGRLEVGRTDLDADRTHGLEGVSWLDGNAHVVWIDIPSGGEWRSEQAGNSRHNPREAELVARVVADLLPECRRVDREIGVISLYGAQVRTIARVIDGVVRRGAGQAAVRVRTVDKFQGMERDVIVLSLCVNGQGVSEFLRKHERVNVAMSRARRLLVIVGSADTYRRAFDGVGSPYSVFFSIAREHRNVRAASDVLDAS